MAGQECRGLTDSQRSPVTPGVRRLNWHLPDPKNLPLEQVRPNRDQINKRVRELAHERDQTATAA
jgi:protein-tyrosine-phosphatase